MATFDREKGEIVVRIVYDGAAHTGKTANLRALRDIFGHRARGELYVPAETSTGRTLYFDWLELHVGQLDDRPLRCEVLTVPGQFAFAERRFHLLHGIDAAVLVCESTPQGVRVTRHVRGFLERVTAALGNAGLPIIVQANKQDMAGALSPSEVEAALGLAGKGRVVPASAILGDGVRATFLAALDAARNAVRLRLASGGPESLDAPLGSPESLYRAMLDRGDASADPTLVRALDEALAEAIGAADGGDAT